MDSATQHEWTSGREGPAGGHARIVASVLLAFAGVLASASEATSGVITIAGNGPELPVIEQLAHEFERSHVGTVVEIRWDPSFHPINMVKSREADFAVAAQTDPDLVGIPIAWDGIAIVVDFTNPVKEVTSQQVAAMFSGKVTQWSALGGNDGRIEIIDRPPNQHVQGTFEAVLGIVGQIPSSAHVKRSDQRAISTVAGNRSAVTYASLGVALDAVTYGVGVALLSIDGVEPAKQTVKDGRYPFRRPVLLLRKREAIPAAEAFAGFARSREGQDIVEETFVRYSALEK